MTQVTTTKVVEGESHIVVRVDLMSDGVGELDHVAFLSPQDLIPPRPNNRATFRLMQVWWGLVWFDVTIFAGIIVPTQMWTLTRDTDTHTDFRSFGGLLDVAAYNQPPSDDSGILTLSTNGFAVAGSQGTFVLELRKTNAPS